MSRRDIVRSRSISRVAAASVRALEHAPRFLNPDGTLVIEVGHNRASVELAFPRLPFVWLETAASPDSVFLLKREELVDVR